MKCMDSTYHCLCAYLIDGRPDQEALRVIQSDPELCPKCGTCADIDRSRQIKYQRYVRSFIQRRCPGTSAPNSLRDGILHRLGMEQGAIP